MSVRPLSVLSLCLVLISPTLARAQAAVPVLEPRYWQVLSGVGWVHVDNFGNPWYRTATGDVAATYHKEVRTIPPSTKLLLGDRQGRIWLQELYKQADVRCYDGKVWKQVPVKARQAFEAADGRVFLLDATHVHVLDRGTWSAQRVFAKDSYPHAHFAEDRKGRVWFWAPATPKSHWGEAAGTRGVWSHAGGKWVNHHPGTGFPVEDVAHLFPWNEGRFVILRREGPHEDNFFVWSPDRKLTDKERSLLPPGHTARRIGYAWIDLDGVRYFNVEGLAAPGKEYPGRLQMVAVSPTGAARVLTAREKERFQSLFHGLYENAGRAFGRLSDKPSPVPVQPGEAICRDREGRVYFRHHPGIGVVWPKYEKPGDVLRVERAATAVRRVFQDSAGGIWGQTEYEPVALRRWSGKGWEDTPVKIPPHPPWTARRGPPWLSWTQPRAHFITGRGGMVLAVVVRDVYQDAFAKEPEKLKGWQAILQAGQARLQPGAPEHWLEGWLLREGQWLGPLKLENLVGRERLALANHFTEPSRRGAAFALQGDGKGRVWLARDGKVFVHDGDGVAEWTVPGKKSGHEPALSLCLLPDGRMLCASPAKLGYQLHALTAKGGRITAEPFAAPKWPDYVSQWQAPGLLVSKGGDLFLWLGLSSGSRELVWVRRGGQWVERKDLGRPLFEQDGAVWCLPGEGHQHGHKDRGYRIVRGDKTITFPWPNAYSFGELTVGPDGKVYAACDYWLVALERAPDEPAGRRIGRAQILGRYLGPGPAFRDSAGNFAFNAGWVGPAAALKE
ncbi:MAG: hypothetical protein L0Z62_23270 [Gemmataceae bacterium]|nr:hypothetical protein [Gemmataceae bacterium]